MTRVDTDASQVRESKKTPAGVAELAAQLRAAKRPTRIALFVHGSGDDERGRRDSFIAGVWRPTGRR